MEEADILSDRIAIMKRGQIACCGTSLSLKRKYGNGLRLTLVTESGDVSKSTEFVQKLLPDARLARTAMGVLHYEVDEDAKTLIPFLEKAQEHGNEAGIIDTQVGLTTLEDVFLRVGGLEDEEEQENVEANEKEDIVVVDRRGKSPAEGNPSALETIDRMSQTRALLKKSTILQSRQYKTNLCQVRIVDIDVYSRR